MWRLSALNIWKAEACNRRTAEFPPPHSLSVVVFCFLKNLSLFFVSDYNIIKEKVRFSNADSNQREKRTGEEIEWKTYIPTGG